MQEKTIYHYDPENGLCLGAGLADPCSQVEGEFLIPAFATDRVPPETPEGMGAFWRDGAWVIGALPKPRPAPEATPAPELPPPARGDRIVQQYLDGLAHSMGYESMAVAVSYAEEDAVPKYQHEGRMLRRLRSLAWEAWFTLAQTFEVDGWPEGDELEQIIRDRMPAPEPEGPAA